MNKKKWAKILIITWMAELFLVFNVAAWETDPPRKSWKERKNGICVKIGGYYFEENKRTDIWNMDENDVADAFVALGYERVIVGLLGLEFSLGMSKSFSAIARGFYESYTGKTDFVNFHMSQSINFYLPKGDRWAVYAGLGPDLYCDTGILNFKIGSKISYDHKNDNWVIGGHSHIGINYLLYAEPWKDGWIDWPVSLDIRYKYGWIGQNDKTKEVVSNIRDLTHLVSGDWFEISGHTVTIGLKWHF